MNETLARQDEMLLRSARFRADREQSWQRLQRLVDKASARGLHALGYQEAMELNRLYHLAVNSLSVARSISMDKALIDYLDALCARAYLVIYAPQKSLVGVTKRFFMSSLPRAVRQSWLAMLIGFSAFWIGALMAYFLFQYDPSWYYSFVDPDLADGRTPSASTEYLRSTLYDGDDMSSQWGGVFSSYLFSHNTGIAIFIFAIGIFCVVPAYALTFYNGLMLGAFYANFASKGLGYDVFAWLSIHGVTEISAICVACAAGAKIGLAVLLPGEYTRRESLKRQGRDATKLILLASIMLLVAALVEGYLRQWIQSPEWRLGIGWGLGAFWVLWLGLAGRGEEAS